MIGGYSCDRQVAVVMIGGCGSVVMIGECGYDHDR